MARKISISPIPDEPRLGSFSITSNTLSTLGTNENLVLDPNGSGIVESDSTVAIRNQGALRLLEASGNGTNYIALQAAANMTANYTITWPAAVSGTNGFFLSSDTSGNLSWSSAAGGIAVTDPGASATAHYLFFGTNAGAVPTAFGPNARSNLSFVPSTGTLTASAFSGNVTSSSVTITGGSINNTPIGASTRANGSFATLTATTVTEDSSVTLKTNINPISNALDAVLQLVGVTYDRIDGSQKNEAGLIAEDVFKILPDLVSVNEKGEPAGIKYTKLTAYLIESVKTLKNELNEIKSANNGASFKYNN